VTALLIIAISFAGGGLLGSLAMLVAADERPVRQLAALSSISHGLAIVVMALALGLGV